MIPGEVRNVRELRRGIEADICVGVSAEHGYVTVHVRGASPPVKDAMANLKKALREEATAAIASTQRSRRRAADGDRHE